MSTSQSNQSIEALRRIRRLGTLTILLVLAGLGTYAASRVHIERATQLYTLLFLLAVIGVPLIYLLWGATKPPKR